MKSNGKRGRKWDNERNGLQRGGLKQIVKVKEEEESEKRKRDRKIELV